jgi:hypothetical protein
VRRRAILEVAERQRPRPRRSYGRGAGLEDAADNPSKSSSFHSPEEREADAMADGTLDSQVGGRPYLQWTGIMRACLETQKLEQLEARMDEIADRVRQQVEFASHRILGGTSPAAHLY